MHFSTRTHFMVTIETDKQTRLVATIEHFPNEMFAFFCGRLLFTFLIKKKKPQQSFISAEFLKTRQNKGKKMYRCRVIIQTCELKHSRHPPLLLLLLFLLPLFILAPLCHHTAAGKHILKYQDEGAGKDSLSLSLSRTLPPSLSFDWRNRGEAANLTSVILLSVLRCSPASVWSYSVTLSRSILAAAAVMILVCASACVCVRVFANRVQSFHSCLCQHFSHK